MNTNTRIKLSFMMFLQFFTWGAWYGQMSKYLFNQLSATGEQVGQAYSAFSIAMIIAPFFVGLVADRYFAAQKVMAALNILGAIVLYFLIKVNDPSLFYWWILAYCLCFAPTIALANAIVMGHSNNPSADFPTIRVMGTIAWFAVTNLVSYLKAGDQSTIFYISMLSSLVLGVYSLMLPNTPPVNTKKVAFLDILGKDAWPLFGDRSFLIFFISSVLVSIPLSFYYAMANPSLTDGGMANVESKMSLGLLSEFLFLLAIPFFMRRFGIKWVIVIGLIGWILRFYLFSIGYTASLEWLLIIAILLHGLCFDFFFVSGQIYTEQKAGATIKTQAQGIITLATYGIGMYIGSLLAGIVTNYYTSNGIKNWGSIWLVPMAISAVILLFFLLFFNDNQKLASNLQQTK
jgi:nucleoside transporter